MRAALRRGRGVETRQMMMSIGGGEGVSRNDGVLRERCQIGLRILMTLTSWELAWELALGLDRAHHHVCSRTQNT